ncbi:hypothetical protein [Terrimonas pollutisoli]|uniref:hypothetical protein n=1 Tax=Terrimonas pollutisoli TaxID=3034147 RepID=UPI0023ED83FF|nr:hypothetical protein [Terrimonas sp. H1YJ31]
MRLVLDLRKNWNAENGMKYFEKMNRREENYLKRVENAKADSRLGCQSLLLEGEDDIDILVPVQT